MSKQVKLMLGEKLKLFKEKGWKYNPDTGDIFSHTGRKIQGKNKNGYITCNIGTGDKIISTGAHQLAWFLYTSEIPNVIDHIDRNILNNKISNLRNGTPQTNQFNRDGKGYRFHKGSYNAYISLNNKAIHLGCFNTGQEAKQAYLDAKKIYHIM